MVSTPVLSRDLRCQRESPVNTRRAKLHFTHMSGFRLCSHVSGSCIAPSQSQFSKHHQRRCHRTLPPSRCILGDATLALSDSGLMTHHPPSQKYGIFDARMESTTDARHTPPSRSQLHQPDGGSLSGPCPPTSGPIFIQSSVNYVGYTSVYPVLH